MTGHRFHVVLGEVVNLRSQGDHVALFHAVAGAVDPLSVDQDVAVHDHLPRGPDGPGEARPADDVVQPLLQHLEQNLAGVALTPRGLGHVAPELLLQHAVVESELLLLVEPDPVVAQTPAAIPVHARRGELPLGGVLGDVGDGGADASRELHLGADVSSHRGVLKCTTEPGDGAVPLPRANRE